MTSRCQRCKIVYKSTSQRLDGFKRPIDINKQNFSVQYPKVCFDCEYNQIKPMGIKFTCVVCQHVKTRHQGKYIPEQICLECIALLTCEVCHQVKKDNIFRLYNQINHCQDCSQKMCQYCQKNVWIDEIDVGGHFCCQVCKTQQCHQQMLTTNAIHQTSNLHELCGMDHPCCICRDQRPFQKMYSGYIDGQGQVENQSRWAYYCHHCYDYFETLSGHQKN